MISFALGQVWWSVVPGLEPSFLAATFGMLPIGLGVGLALPTLMGLVRHRCLPHRSRQVPEQST